MQRPGQRVLTGTQTALLLAGLCAALLAPPARAADKKEKKEDTKPQPPHIAMTLPLVTTPVTTNRVKIRGQHLTNVTELRFTNATLQVEVKILSNSKADVPRDFDAKKVGDTQLEVEVTFPAGTPPSTNYFIVVSPVGRSEPAPLLVLPSSSLLEEREPNGGFKLAQSLEPGKTLLGTLKESADVDVFRLEGRAGQRVRVEVTAARLGAATDALLTLYDSGGRILASNDDAGGRADPLLAAKLPADGRCFIGVVDAYDRSGPMHAYLLRATLE